VIKFFISFFLVCFNTVPSDLIQTRNLYEKLKDSEVNTLALKKVVATSTSISPGIKKAYLAVAHMALAQYRVSPIYKWKAFNEGKAALEDAIKEDSTLLEVRYIRLCIQQHAPSILGYNTKIKNDRDYLVSNLNALKKDDPDLFVRVYTYLLVKANLSQAEKNLINA
jgi:hypothetical protein